MIRIIITERAQDDIRSDYGLWREHRSAEQADRWYLGIHAAIESLRRTPERCPMTTESDLLVQGIRQQLFGLGRRATHRIVFVIDGDTVVVLRVRHSSQGALALDEI